MKLLDEYGEKCFIPVGIEDTDPADFLKELFPKQYFYPWYKMIPLVHKVYRIEMEKAGINRFPTFGSKDAAPGQNVEMYIQRPDGRDCIHVETASNGTVSVREVQSALRWLIHKAQ